MFRWVSLFSTKVKIRKNEVFIVDCYAEITVP